MALTAEQAALVKGMLQRGDKQHDVAAYFGVNGGRVAEIATGAKFADVKPAPLHLLPPVAGSAGAADERRRIRASDPLDMQIANLNALISSPPQNSRICEFGPMLAKHILDELNKGNRRPQSVKISEYADALSENRWGMTGDTIKFGSHGLLLDGQNRLGAVTRSTITLVTHVVFGIDPKEFAHIDRGKVRTLEDILTNRGIRFPGEHASALKWIYRLRSSDGRERVLPALDYMVQDYEEEGFDTDWLYECVVMCRPLTKLRQPVGMVAAFAYLIGQRGPTERRKVREFIEAWIDQKDPRGLSRTRSPVLRLQEEIKNILGVTNGRIHERHRLHLIAACWSRFAAGRAVETKDLEFNLTFSKLPVVFSDGDAAAA